ncbi:hypothetical protein WR25_03440 [Diploscapter pachys]|uniref:LEM domain-containing protein n=1 Tax=Diploscapter pachys TaxID=2018661 RepID=A0A2A2J7W8_9BILA|nr:hypothetical protein WR25_03440 [Diploscapter pachys]
MVDVVSMSDAELRQQLLDNGIQAGPITDTTRNIYRKKLQKILMEGGMPISDGGGADPAQQAQDDSFDDEEPVPRKRVSQKFATPAGGDSPLRNRRHPTQNDSDKNASDIDSDDSNYEGSRVLNQHEMMNQLSGRRLSPPRVNKSNSISRIIGIVGLVVLLVTVYFILDHVFNDPEIGGGNREPV